MAKRGGNIKSLVGAQALPPLEFKKLFVLGGGGLDEDNWRETFSNFGSILKVNIMTDKKTGRQKGMCHILFDKTSEAALAMEHMSGQHIGGDKPLKIMFAQDKRDNLEMDCDEDKMLQRIFIKCSKTQSDLDLTSDFGTFGSVEFVRILKDNNSGESRGLAFIKFSKQSNAARALEECDDSYKARWADVRVGGDEDGKSGNACYNCGKTGHYSNECPGKSGTRNYTSNDPYANNMNNQGGGGGYDGGYGGGDPYGFNQGGFNQGGYNQGGFNQGGFNQGGFNGNFNQGGFNQPMAFGQPTGFGHQGHQSHQSHQGGGQFGQGNMGMGGNEPEKQAPDTVEALIPASMTEEQAKSLFSVAPGYQSHNVIKCGPSSIAKVTYKSPKCAAYAKEKIDGMDYAGEKIAVRFGKIKSKAELQKSAIELQNTLAALTAKGGADPNELVQIMQSISKVTEAIQNPEPEEQDLGEEMVPWCSVPLPVKKPLASASAAVVARLFVVAIPDKFSDELLLNAFSRFGDLVTVKFQPDKRFGFAHFANQESAEAAKSKLHGQYIANNRLKVEFTQGPKLDKGEGEPARKRGRDF